MDAGEDLHTHGNGQPNPKIASLPSAGGTEAVAPKSQPPQEAALEAPASSSPAAGEKPAEASDGARDAKSGRFKPGKSGNPKGRTPGIPNLNEEICAAAKRLKMGDRKYIELLLLKALQDPRYAELIVPRIFADATPSTAAPLIDASDKSQHHHLTENHVRIGEHLSDAGTRDAVAELTQRLAARGAFTGEPRHVRQ